MTIIELRSGSVKSDHDVVVANNLSTFTINIEVKILSVDHSEVCRLLVYEQPYFRLKCVFY